MDREQALRDVQEIKQVIDKSRKWSGRGKLWGIIALVVLAMVLSAIVPFLAPIIAIGFIGGGVVVYRRTDDSLTRGVAAGAIAIGIMMLLMTLLVVVGLISYSTSTTVQDVIIIPKP